LVAQGRIAIDDRHVRRRQARCDSWRGCWFAGGAVLGRGGARAGQQAGSRHPQACRICLAERFKQ
jgi:hypothetical protein